MIYHIFVDLLSMCCLHFQNLKFWRTRKRKTQKLVKYISYTSNLSITVKVIVILTYSHSLLFNTLVDQIFKGYFKKHFETLYTNLHFFTVDNWDHTDNCHIGLPYRIGTSWSTGNIETLQRNLEISSTDLKTQVNTLFHVITRVMIFCS